MGARPGSLVQHSLHKSLLHYESYTPRMQIVIVHALTQVLARLPGSGYFTMSNAQTLSLYRDYQLQLVNYACSIVGDIDRAEDIAQDAYLRFSVAMDEDRPDNPVGYLYRVVRNLALDYRRRGQFEKKLFSQSVDEWTEVLSDDRYTPEQEVISSDALEKLQRVMKELPERTRVALEMHRLQEYKLREIAEHLNISLSMAQYLVKEGLTYCQSRLSQPSL